MGILSGYQFLLLPSRAPSRVQFFAKLIEANSGVVVDRYSPDIVILVNDTFVDKSGHLAHIDIFHSEWEYDDSILGEIWSCDEPKCYRMSWISECLKQHRVVTDSTLTMSLSWDNEMIEIQNAEPDEKSEGVELVDSNDETDVGSHQSTELSEYIPLPQEKQVENATKLIVDNPNSDLIAALEHLVSRYRLKGDVYRSRSYQLALQTIRGYGKRIQTEQEALSLPHVGASIARKIQIILQNGSLPGLQESGILEKQLDYFMNCHGVGAHIARKWYDLGARTFKSASELSPSDFHWTVLYGWCFYEDWLARIPREECEMHLRFIQSVIKEVDQDVRIELTGSYRRGAEECGDIDTVMYKPGCDDMQEISQVLERVISVMYDQNYLLCPLNLNWRLTEIFKDDIEQIMAQANLKASFVGTGKDILKNSILVADYHMGFLVLQKRSLHSLKPEDSFLSRSNSQDTCRRVDILLCKWSELGSAMIYFTGNDDFNKSLRLRASSKGWKLNHHGLFSVELEDSKGVSKSTLIESFDERRIMELLGVAYVPPMERNVEGYI